MTETAVIESLADVVRRACQAPANAFGYGIWTHHIEEVARLAVELAPDFGADEEVVEIAALLHDYASVKDFRFYHDHHVHSALEAEKLLRSYRLPEEKIQAVKACIAEHRASLETVRQSPEAKCLASADALAHMAQVPSLLYYAYVHRGMSIDEGCAWVREKLERSWKKLDPRLHERVRAKYEAALITLQASGR